MQRLTSIARVCSAAGVQPFGAASLLALNGGVLGIAGQRQAGVALHTSPVGLRAGGTEQPPAHSDEQQSPGLSRKALINRMLYRSRQRGFLELDLLIGMWAERELPRMPLDLVAEFEAVLDHENPDMFKWLTGQAAPPQEVHANRAFQALRAHVKAMTDAKHSVPPAAAAAAEEPLEWLRGWTDTGKELPAKGGA